MKIKDRTRELLFSVTKKDFIVETMRSSKSGGQRRDKVSTAVRITHPDSGATGFSQDQRSQDQNKRLAFRRLLETKEWRDWHRIETARRMGQLLDIDEQVDRAMQIKNLKIEVIKGGKFVEE